MEVVNNIEQWAVDRGLHKADPSRQFLKLSEEVGELAASLAKGRDPRDSLGDVGVVLIILCRQLGWEFEHVLEVAYAEIKERKGKMVNGVFIKEADLCQSQQ